MSLERYHQKRNFKKTPEPKGKTKKSSKNKLLYVIQKHAASHLHYDFRLELQGVLVSFAVPKGPSLDPAVKRLAMHVEDHPLEYGSFEGIIPEGQYGAGTVMLWDRGEWIPEISDGVAAYKKGSLTFALKGEKLQGLWKLIRMKQNDKTWLLFKIKDEFAKSAKKFDITEAEPNSVLSHLSLDEISLKSKNRWTRDGLVNDNSIKKKNLISEKILKQLKISSYPTVIFPQLATLVDIPPSGKKWLHEIKLDGYRLIAFKKGKKVRLMTRRNHDWTHCFPDIAEKIANLPVKNAIFDGEVVVLDDQDLPNFQLLQMNIQLQKHPFIYYLFDLLYIDQYDLMNLALIERKKLLKQILSQQADNFLRYNDHLYGEGEEIFKKACQLNFEGIISKDSTSPYLQKRTTYWLKIKCLKRQEFIIIGFTPPKGKRSYFGSLMLATYNKQGELIYHGNVGTGFNEASLKKIYDDLVKIKTQSTPLRSRPPGTKNVTWVKPKLIAEVEFTEWTQSGIVRAPSFKGLRSDKKPKEISQEKAVKISNRNRIIYPEDQITKGDIANYYETISEWILPFIVDRPLTIVRCPENYKECFFQKHLNEISSSELHPMMITEKNKKEEYFYIKNIEGLLTLAQFGALELHPWGSRCAEVDYPDIIIFDLDPAPDVKWKEVVAAAFDLKKQLQTMHLKSFVKTTGGKGLHVVVPIKAEYEWGEVKLFSHVLVDFLAKKNPKKYVSQMTKSKRQGKIFLDYLRNQRGATAIAPYSPRNRIHAPIATPVAWNELTDHYEDTFFTIKTLPKRLEKLKQDPWKSFFDIKQSLNLEKL